MVASVPSMLLETDASPPGTSTFSQNVIWLNASEAITNFPSAFVSDDAYYVLTRSALAKPWGQLRSNVLTKAKAIYIDNEATLVLAGVLLNRTRHQ